MKKKEKKIFEYTNGLNYRINFSNQKIKYINSVYLFYSFKPQQSKHLLIISAFLNCWENVFSPALSSSTQGPMNTCELRGLETTSFLVLHAQKGRKMRKEIYKRMTHAHAFIKIRRRWEGSRKLLQGKWWFRECRLLISTFVTFLTLRSPSPEVLPRGKLQLFICSALPSGMIFRRPSYLI